MAKEYLTVVEFADWRSVSPSTVKRRIADGTIKKVKKVPGPFDQEKYMIHRSQVSMRQEDLFGPKRPPVNTSSGDDENQTLINSTELLAEIQYIRKTNSITDKRLEALELTLSK